MLLLGSRHTHRAGSLCLARDELPGTGNLALIQLLLKAKQLILSLAEAEIQLARKAQVTTGVQSRKDGSKTLFSPLRKTKAVERYR